MLFTSACLAIFAINAVSADVRVVLPAVRETQVYYIDQLKTQNMDNMVRSNIVNQHKKRSGTEVVKTMLPCRSVNPMAEPVVYTRGSSVQYLMRFNNPHDGQCEINLWKNGQTMPLMTPKPCGGGAERAQFNFTMPANAPACAKGDGCFMQFYFFSAEPRDYAQCTDIIIAGNGIAGAQTPAPILPKSTTAATNTTRKTRRAATGMVPGKMFRDGDDYKNANDDYNQYRGQQGATTQYAARFRLEEAVGKGKDQVIKDKALDGRRAALATKIKELIKTAEGTRNAELATADEQLRRGAESRKQIAISTFNQNSTTIVYPEDTPFSGLARYGTTIDGTNNKRQRTNTYVAGMNFVTILAGIQGEVTSMIAARKAAGDFNPYSDGI